MLLRNIFLLGKGQLRNFSCDLMAKMGRMPRIVDLSKATTGKGETCGRNYVVESTCMIYNYVRLFHSKSLYLSVC